MDRLTIKVTAIFDAHSVAVRREGSEVTAVCDRCQDAREAVVAKDRDCSGGKGMDALRPLPARDA